MTRSSKPSHYTASDAEHFLIDRAAVQRGETRSAFVRRAAVTEAQRVIHLLDQMMQGLPEGTRLARVAGTSWDTAVRAQQTGLARPPETIRPLENDMIVSDGSRMLRLVKHLQFRPPDGNGEYWAYELLEGSGPWDIDQRFVDSDDPFETTRGIVILPWVAPVGADS